MKDEDIYRMLTEKAPAAVGEVQDADPPHSPEFLSRATNPGHLGEVASPDGYAMEQGECGDAMMVFLSVAGRVIRTARFDTLGCGYTVACGDAAMEMAEGRTLSDALGIRPEQIAQALGGLPASHEHCARLAVQTLRSAIRNAMDRAREPWKKLYG